MCQCTDHEFDIQNFFSGEVVTYSLIKINGELKTTCQEKQIYLELNGETFCMTLHKDNFHFLVELKPDENRLFLRYCSSSFDMTINYKPRDTQLTVLPLYIICDGHHGLFQAPSSESSSIESALKRITLGVKMLQALFAERLHAEGFRRKTFRLEKDCQVFRSKLHYLEAYKMTQEQLWNTLGAEIIVAFEDYERYKFLGFLSCTNYDGHKYKEGFTHDDLIKITDGYVALGGGGFALFGTGCLYTWPEQLFQVTDYFFKKTKINPKRFLDDSNYKGTWKACYSTTLGSVLHELCHTFDLGHTEDGIMARDFDDLYKEFICNGSTDKRKDAILWTRNCVLILAYHRWFNNHDPEPKKLAYDEEKNLFRASAGLRVIELRKVKEEMVLLNWTFENRILRFYFKLPEEDIKELSGEYVLFVMDNVGGTLKKTITL